VFFGSGCLLLLVLLFLLLLEDGLNVFASIFNAILLSKYVCAALLHQVLHHIANLLHEEGD
jgi:hypothetical protein